MGSQSLMAAFTTERWILNIKKVEVDTAVRAEASSTYKIKFAAVSLNFKPSLLALMCNSLFLFYCFLQISGNNISTNCLFTYRMSCCMFRYITMTMTRVWSITAEITPFPRNDFMVIDNECPCCSSTGQQLHFKGEKCFGKCLRDPSNAFLFMLS